MIAADRLSPNRQRLGPLLLQVLALSLLLAVLATPAEARRPAGDSAQPPATAVAVGTTMALVQQALALAGAPATTPLECSHDVPGDENGWAWWSPTSLILLKPDVCDGLAWLQGDTSLRLSLERSQPFTAWPGQAGVSALVLLHEAAHIAGDHDETDAECRARRLLPTLLVPYLDGPALAQALGSASAYDSFLPPPYHQRPC